ncbi:hypothetical protein BH24CHL4_BH24CHL4_17760 [soil metagenome]
MEKRRNVSVVVVIAAFALVTGLMFGGSVAAQDTGTPDATDGMMMDMAHPGHIHTGTCDEVGDVVFPLTDATSPDMMGTPEAGMEDMGTPDDTAAADDMDDMDDMHGEVVAESVTTVTVTFDDLMAAEHVINFHESAENIGNYIACGAITGEASAEGELEIELDEVNDSGFEGHAMLVDNGDGTIEVTVKLMMVMDDMGTPEASPTS